MPRSLRSAKKKSIKQKKQEEKFDGKELLPTNDQHLRAEAIASDL
jgi:hypothetical protein